MTRDEIAAEIAERLAQHLPDGELSTTPEEDLIAAMKYAADTRRDLQIVVGQIAAELHRRGGRSWRQIAEACDMDHVTLYRWARPFTRDAS